MAAMAASPISLETGEIQSIARVAAGYEYINQIARRTVLSEDAFSVLAPMLEITAGWNAARIREFFEARGFVLREWDKMQTDGGRGQRRRVMLEALGWIATAGPAALYSLWRDQA
jgi:hypothetical protein